MLAWDDLAAGGRIGLVAEDSVHSCVEAVTTTYDKQKDSLGNEHVLRRSHTALMRKNVISVAHALGEMMEGQVHVDR